MTTLEEEERMQTSGPLEGITGMPPVVALTGLAGSGKSAAADFLVSLGYVRIKFAGPLKDMLRAIGLGDREIEGDMKEEPCDILCGATPRRAMQTLGTEWGRDIISNDLWVSAWRHRVRCALAAGAVGVVVDDCRFPNEMEAARELGGVAWRIVRRGHFATAAAHASEAGAHEMNPDAIILNDRDIAHLHDNVRNAIYGATAK
jgi:hypothetical protein